MAGQGSLTDIFNQAAGGGGLNDTLLQAVKNNNVDIVKALLDAGADINLRDPATAPPPQAPEEPQFDPAKIVMSTSRPVKAPRRARWKEKAATPLPRRQVTL